MKRTTKYARGADLQYRGWYHAKVLINVREFYHTKIVDVINAVTSFRVVTRTNSGDELTLVVEYGGNGIWGSNSMDVRRLMYNVLVNELRVFPHELRFERAGTYWMAKRIKQTGEVKWTKFPGADIIKMTFDEFIQRSAGCPHCGHVNNEENEEDR